MFLICCQINIPEKRLINHLNVAESFNSSGNIPGHFRQEPSNRSAKQEEFGSNIEIHKVSQVRQITGSTGINATERIVCQCYRNFKSLVYLDNGNTWNR